MGFSVSLGVLYPSRVTSDSSAMTSAVLREKEKERTLKMAGGLSMKHRRPTGATYMHKNYQGFISDLRSWERMGRKIKVVLFRKSSVIFVNIQLRTSVRFPERAFALRFFFPKEEKNLSKIFIDDV